MTELQRLSGVIVAPDATFRDIGRRPTWLLPLLVFIAFSLLLNFVVFRVVVTDSTFPQVAAEAIQWDATADHVAATPALVQRQTNALRNMRQHWYVLPVYGAVLGVLGLTVFFYLVLLVLRAGTSFVKVLAVVCWSFPIYRGIGSAVTLVWLLVRGPARFRPVPAEAWSPTSLAHLVSRSAVSPHVYSAISKLDVFLIWWLVVLAIGFARTSVRLSVKKSLAVVFASEVVYLALNAAGWLPGAS